MIIKHTGWLPGKNFGPQVYSAVNIKDRFPNKIIDLEIDMPIPYLYNQLDSSTCVVQAFAGCLATKYHADDIYPIRHSRLQMYYHARRFHQELEDLQDTGTSIKTCALGCRRYGIAEEREYPFELEKINDQPGFSILVSAKHLRGMEYYEFPEENKIEWMLLALNNGYPFIFGAWISNDFMNFTGDIFDEPKVNGPRFGHAMYCNGYRYVGSELQFHIVNSWGGGFGNSGQCYVTIDFMRDAQECTVLFV
jgi:hypothetical protein